MDIQSVTDRKLYYLLLFAGELLRIYPSRFVASLITAGTVPVAKDTYRDSEQDVRDDEGEDQVPQIVIPGIARNHIFRISFRIEARKWFANVFVTGKDNIFMNCPLVLRYTNLPVLPGELRAIYSGRISATLRVYEQPRLSHVPSHCFSLLLIVLVKRNFRIIH